MQEPDLSGGESEPSQTPGSGSRAIRNTALVLAARVVSRLVALVTVLAIINHLEDRTYGQFQAVVNVMGVVAVFVDLGFNTLFVREGARHPGEIQRYLNNVLSVKALLSVICLLVLAIALSIQGLGGFILPAFVLMVLTAYANLLRNTLYAIQSLNPEAIAIVLESLVLLALVLYGIRRQSGATYYLWAYAGSQGFSCLYFGLVLGIRQRLRFGWRFERALLKEWFWAGLPFALTFVLTALYFKIDQPIVRLIRGDAEAGWYAAAYKPFEAILFVPISMLSVAFPVLSIYHRQDPERLRSAVNLFFKALVLLGWPLSVGAFLVAHGINGFLHYPQSEPAVRILATGIIFMFASNAAIAALNAMDKQALFTRAAGASVVLNLALNFTLIPTFGYLGASWATVVTEIGLVAIGLWMVARNLGPVPVLSATWRIVLAGLVMGVAVWPFRDITGWRLLPVIGLGAAVYAGAVFLLRGLGPDELAMARAAVRGGGS